MELRIDLQDVESNQIHSIGHDPTTNTLAICFISRKGGVAGPGSIYHYANFGAAEFEAFSGAESLGKHFGQYIKPFPQKYPYHKVSAVPQAA